MNNDIASRFLVIDYDGTLISVLNPQLADQQGVTDQQLEALRASHIIRAELFKAATHGIDNDLLLTMVANVFDALETEQQKLWNFPPDPNHHRFFDVPGCRCPKHDNAERIGTPSRIYSNDCPIHGRWVTEVIEDQKTA